MPASSSGVAEKSESPRPLNTIRLPKEAPRHAGSRRGSAASWLHPLSSTEVPDLDHPHNPLYPRHGFQVGNSDYLAGANATTSSLFSATESSPLHGHESSTRKGRGDGGNSPASGKRDTRSGRGYGRLAGLLSRRGGDGSKSRKSLVRSSSNTTSQLESAETATQGTSVAAPRRSTTRNPLQRSGTLGELDAEEEEELGLGEGGGGATTTAGSGTRTSIVNSTLQNRTRRELSISPLTAHPSRAMTSTTTRPDSAVHVAGGVAMDSSAARFVPLGSADLTNRNGSPNRLQRSYNSGAEDERSAASGTLRNRSQRHKLISGSSLSTSASQSLGQLGSARALQLQASRTVGDMDSAAPLSLSVRNVRDAKVVLLRRAQQGNGTSLRSSRTHSFLRIPSTASVGGGDPALQRGGRTRPNSREKRSTNGLAVVIASNGGSGSPFSTTVADDDTVRTSASPAGVGSPLAHSGMGFPGQVSAVDMGSGRSVHNVSVGGPQASRRLSRTEDNPLLEVMETSGFASQLGYEPGAGAAWWPATGEPATRSRTTVVGASSSRSTDRRTTAVSRDESPFQRSSSTRCGVFYPARAPSGYHSLSRTGGYDSSGDSEEDLRLRERHRSRVDEVLRQLNAPARSTTVDERGTAASVRNRSSSPVARDLSAGAASAEHNSNSTASGWAGIGGIDWSGGLAALRDVAATGTATTGADATGAAAPGATTATPPTTTNDNGGGGGWLGVGAATSSDDWYTRMRRRAEEDAAAEAAAAAAAANAGSLATAATSCVTVSSTAPPSLASPAHIPSVASTSHRRSSTQSQTHMPAVDRATANKRPLSSLILPSASVSADTPHPSQSSSSPATAPAATRPRPTPPSVRPAIDASAAAASERALRRVQPSDSARMQLSHTCAALGSSTAASPTAPLQRADTEAPAEVASDGGHSARFRAASINVPVHRPQVTDALGTGLLPELEVVEPCRRLSGVGNSRDGSSGNSSAGTSTAVPTAANTVRRPSDTLSPTPPLASGGAAPSHRQFDVRRRCSLPRVLPTMNTAVLGQAPSGQPTSSANTATTPGHTPVQRGARVSIPTSSGASCPSNANASLAAAASTSRSSPHLSSPSSAIQGRVAPVAAARLESAMSNGLRRNPSAPARVAVASARAAERSTNSSGAPPAVLASTRLSYS
ncbi:hypothetical protein NESM_000585600 [Novymonas esmeraldas]|uniref:Uncharacterized protein n=1 Tax=Novymonas esmeraldas TaxID=1808958 RepID=A0AAW0ETJ7_9TRYP